MGSENRRSPRYSRQLDVDVDGLEIVTTNVAIGGVQLCCPEMRYPGFQAARRGPDDGMQLKIRLPAGQNWLRIAGRIRYANPCEDEYLIGFQFTGREATPEGVWAAYIDTLADAKSI
ncbi:MAG TPA: PilZ domain-containing protein [Gammaproteobacteria bacterium]|nr:PilZ domain-containing protein [Gammaproteobacteria bacterium]